MRYPLDIFPLRDDRYQLLVLLMMPPNKLLLASATSILEQNPLL